ncbi:AAA family ATPase [Spirosoma rigui]|uniref:AAA family ATPase n=1 Tax=Spirosoma rigui TaxID=564064 RepID=UPI0009AF43DC|nr:ATP-binding protein [Spirosoma rigui]
MEYFPIIQALCRSALSSPSNAVLHQVERLRIALEKDGHDKEAKSIGGLLLHADRTSDMAPSRIQRSTKVLAGEELSTKTAIPVDKETSTPLAEIVFPNDLPSDSPIFSGTVASAVESILNEWKNFEKLEEIEAQPSRSCLIFGAPGTGKTHLAMWIAKEINIPVVLVRLDGLMSSFLGTTSRNIGNLFAFVNKYRCILLLDEFDAIAKLRNDPQEVGEIKRVVNTLLQSLDSRKKTGFTIGVTNHEALLDPAIWRRFDVQIEIPKPSSEVIASIIQKFVTPLEFDDVQLKFLSWSIEGASGADAENLAKWLKKSSVLNTNQTLFSLVRKFATLNSGRVSLERRNLFTLLSDEDLANVLINDKKLSFKQKDIVPLIGTTASTLSRKISKSKLF